MQRNNTRAGSSAPEGLRSPRIGVDASRKHLLRVLHRAHQAASDLASTARHLDPTAQSDALQVARWAMTALLNTAVAVGKIRGIETLPELITTKKTKSTRSRVVPTRQRAA